MTPIYRLAYVSDAHLQDPWPEIRALLDAAIRNNAACGITGALIYTGRNFFQVLEGPHLAVQKVFSVVAHDPRHDNVHLLGTQESLARRFEGRPMTLLGRSKAAGAYYQDYIAGRVRRNAVPPDALVALMLRLIALDEPMRLKA